MRQADLIVVIDIELADSTSDLPDFEFMREEIMLISSEGFPDYLLMRI